MAVSIALAATISGKQIYNILKNKNMNNTSPPSGEYFYGSPPSYHEQMKNEEDRFRYEHQKFLLEVKKRQEQIPSYLTPEFNRAMNPLGVPYYRDKKVSHEITHEPLVIIEKKKRWYTPLLKSIFNGFKISFTNRQKNQRSADERSVATEAQ